MVPARGDPGGVSIHDEPGECLAGRTLGVGVGSGQDEVVVGDPAVGDPHLLAVDDPLVPLLLCLSLHSGHVGAGSRLLNQTEINEII